MLEFRINGSPALPDTTADPPPDFGLCSGAVQRLMDALPRSEVARKLSQVGPGSTHTVS